MRRPTRRFRSSRPSKKLSSQHARLTSQAASVIGQQHQLELQLDRKLADIETLSAQARQALVLADDARAKGDESKAQEFEQTAEQIANQLVPTESDAANLKQLHDQSMAAARQAKQAVEDNKLRLQEKLTQRTKLLSQLEQAKMQEQVSASLNQMSELSAPSNTPTLDAVRDKIEKRYANALGQAELANDSLRRPDGRGQAGDREHGGPVPAGRDPRVDEGPGAHAADRRVTGRAVDSGPVAPSLEKPTRHWADPAEPDPAEQPADPAS